MVKEELESKLRNLQKNLNEVKTKRTSAEHDLEQLEDVIRKIEKKKSEVEEGVNDTLRTIDQRLSAVNPRSKFKVQFRDGAISILNGGSYSSAVSELSDLIKLAKNKYSSKETEITVYKKQIVSIAQEIDTVKQQLVQLGGAI